MDSWEDKVANSSSGKNLQKGDVEKLPPKWQNGSVRLVTGQPAIPYCLYTCPFKIEDKAVDKCKIKNITQPQMVI